MKRLLSLCLVLGVGIVIGRNFAPPPATADAGIGRGAAQNPSGNGDVNADGGIDIADAIYLLNWLFSAGPAPATFECPAAGKGLPATGQAQCFEFDAANGIWGSGECAGATCTGQDGARNAGCPIEGRFVDNGDGTVSDTCTGLMWQKDTADLSGDGQINASGDTAAWCEAMSYCEKLSFAGHDDWRLPNVRELQSIVDYGRINPAIDPIFTSGSEYYWSSTSHLEAPDDGWGIGFNNGYVGVRPKVGDFDFSFNYVRAVRNSP